MPQLFSNAAKSTLNAGVLVGDTTLTLADNGAAFPVADRGTGTSGDWFKAVLDDGANLEIVYVRTHTAGSTTFSNVLRGQEGTTAFAFNAGATVGLRLTAQDFAQAKKQSEVLKPAVADMQSDNNLVVGDFVSTLGYYTPGDGGAATYEIVSADTVIGYDEPNIQAFNYIPSIYLANPLIGNWMRINIAASGSGSLADTLLAPNGRTEADFLAETSATGGHYVQLNQTMGAANHVPMFPVGPTEFVSYVAKYDAGDPKRRPYYYCGCALGSNYNLASNQATSIIDLSTGAVTQPVYGSGLSPGRTIVTDAGSYWLVRMQVTPTSVGQCYWQMGAANAPTTNVYAGSDPAVQPKGVYVWGWSIRPLVTPGIVLVNGLQAKPLLSNTVRLSQLGAVSNGDNNALLKALSYFGANPGTLIIDAPTVFTQPSSLATLTIPSNMDLRFEGSGSLAGVTNLTVISQLIAENRAILPRATTATFGPRQRSVLSNWFGL